ncbi:MAG: hypothetical protein V4819_19055 [Verrucomicrobiota bacterium]
MKNLSISLCVLAASLCMGCNDSDIKSETSELDKLVGKDVLISLSQPIAYSWEKIELSTSNSQSSGISFNHEQFLRAKLIKVEPTGIIVKFYDREAWIGKAAVISVIVITPAVGPLEK